MFRKNGPFLVANRSLQGLAVSNDVTQIELRKFFIETQKCRDLTSVLHFFYEGGGVLPIPKWFYQKN